MDMLVRLLISRPAFDEMLTMDWNLGILIAPDDSDSVELEQLQVQCFSKRMLAAGILSA
jgi:hypothetical protein